ncbi:DUF6473 family protein [Octadecabacter sp. CECT 8868]|uniref:DUF6473 family protein n=1 Tax=Octadecabacter algicola TaxID=2909342 RepID=UPI001F389B2D|nr:DUF6473 family protein [Octadecabacter algicola]MCF2905723.1 DUF6473 family protein [Octadecabacter algicola]
MKSDIKPRGALRLAPCHYGLSKLPFRGPMRPTDGRFVAFLGGSETFAKYIRTPYPDKVETEIGEVCINLGFQSAGPDVFLNDTAVQSLCHDAVATIIQVLNAANISNSFYKVHPRRNDRFVGPTDKLKLLFPEVDFTEIAFTGHLIARLRAEDEKRFELVKEHLQRTWIRRMKTLIGRSSGAVVLLWLHQKDTEGSLVTKKMVAALRDYISQIVVVTVEDDGHDGKCYAPLDALSAKEAMGPKTHAAVAKALRGPLMGCLS